MGYLLSVILSLILFAPSVGWAALTFNESKTVSSDTPGAATVAIAAANVASGSYLAACFKWEGAVTLDSIAGTGGDTFTMLTGQTHSGGEPSIRCGRFFSATANASYVATATFSGWPGYVRGVLLEFTYTGTISADTAVGSTEDDTDSTPSSNTLTTAGTDEVCIAAEADYTSTTYSSWTINGVAAGGNVDLSDLSVWYRVLTGTFTGGASSVSRIPTNSRWVQRLFCDYASGGGGAATNYFRLRVQP